MSIPRSRATRWRDARLTLFVTAVLGGCATSQSIELIAPGTYALDCSGGAPTWAGCHSLAQRACEGGDFEIQSQVSNAGSAGVGRNDWSTQGSQITRTMVVVCK
jgi:hypothetical protein